MQIRVNNQPVPLDAPVTLETLLQKLNRSRQGIALAVNQQIIGRSRWSEHRLNDGDSVTLIQATAGG